MGKSVENTNHKSPMRQLISELKDLHQLLPVQAVGARGQLLTTWTKIASKYVPLEQEALEKCFVESRLTNPIIGFKFKDFNEFIKENFSGQSKFCKYDTEVDEVAVSVNNNKYYFKSWDVLKPTIELAEKPQTGINGKQVLVLVLTYDEYCSKHYDIIQLESAKKNVSRNYQSLILSLYCDYLNLKGVDLKIISEVQGLDFLEKLDNPSEKIEEIFIHHYKYLQEVQELEK
jgi:hypothetical protein